MNSEIRTGKISSINYETGMARVTYRDKDETVTAELPFLTNNDEYHMPKVGQRVLTAHLSNGSSRGVIIGTIWHKNYAPKETGKELYRKELSREKDVAYIRYSDETGEYLLKAPDLHLNGINKVIFDGPEMEIAANISILLQTDVLHADCAFIEVTGGETGALQISVQADININQEEHGTEAVILKMMLELLEKLEIRTGTDVQINAGENLELEAGDKAHLYGGTDVEISTGGTLRLSDGSHSITLEEIIEKLDALGESAGDE